jgi:hypothetical protein
VVGKGLNCKFDFDIDNGQINFKCKKNCQHQSTKIFPISKSFYFYSIYLHIQSVPKKEDESITPLFIGRF